MSMTKLPVFVCGCMCVYVCGGGLAVKLKLGNLKIAPRGRLKSISRFLFPPISSSIPGGQLRVCGILLLQGGEDR